jgi:hypothetical protein
VTDVPRDTVFVPVGEIATAARTATTSASLVAGASVPEPAKTDRTVAVKWGVTVIDATPEAFVVAVPNVVHSVWSAFVPWNVIGWPADPAPVSVAVIVTAPPGLTVNADGCCWSADAEAVMLNGRLVVGPICPVTVWAVARSR